MSIDRDPSIRFHEEGTLLAVTRWVAGHDEGVAEWLKNARSAYQPSRADVNENHRATVLLLRDADSQGPARIALLDVGGATIEDVTLWSTWQDPNASRRSDLGVDEGNQGNGGKAYMYRLFRGPARIVGVRDGKLNCKGFEGSADTVERGTPGFMPGASSGREVPITACDAELERELEPYGMKCGDLPKEAATAIRERKAFTLVEGVDPTHLYKGRIDVEDLIRKVLRHDQSALAVQQLRLYVVHNGRVWNAGRAISLEPIAPYPGFATPRISELPEDLPIGAGQTVSTTEGGTRPKGRLMLYTSRDDMPRAHKNLKPRWKISYRTEQQMIGSKPVSELVPATPGSYFIYGVLELAALEPAYVEHGRRRPKDGPLVEAVDAFIAERIRDLAKEISDKRRNEHDQQALDEVHQENKKLDAFKNKFLPQLGDGGDGQGGGGGRGGGRGGSGGRDTTEFGTVPDSIELTTIDDVLRVGRGVKLHLVEVLHVQVKDATGRLVPNVELEWCTSDTHSVAFGKPGVLEARHKGAAEIWVKVKGGTVESRRVPVEVWIVDHVLLSPRTLEIPLGQRKQIIAEVTNDEGYRATNVYLDWRHDADDALIVRIRPTGWVTGNRIGRTAITAGAGELAQGGVWSRIEVEVAVIQNLDQQSRGGGYPRLLLTGRDVDPATGEVRSGDPDSPALWQEVSDYQNNVWWLNVDSPEAAFAFNQRTELPRLWRHFHVTKVIEMVVQVHMQEEFTRRGESEQKDFWANHQAALVNHQVTLTGQMWDKLRAYVEGTSGLD